MANDFGSDDSVPSRYVLRLFVSGATPRSLEAIANIRAICERELKGNYELEVCDVYQQPGLLSEDDVVALPTLIRKLPLPIRYLIGDLSEEKKVLVGLELVPKERALDLGGGGNGFREEQS